MGELLSLMKEFEKRNNLSIDIVLFSDGSASVREYWEEEEFKECVSQEALFIFLEETQCVLDPTDGRCLKPIKFVAKPA